MIENIHAKTGKTVEEWIQIVKNKNFSKHGEIINFLKNEHEFTHGYANLVAHKSKENDLSKNTDELVEIQYLGKEKLKPLYTEVLKFVETLGNEVEISPKKAYVSLRRKKQFATLKPATKTRFEIGINLKGQEPTGKLQAEKPNAMCSHIIKIENDESIDDEIKNWLKLAFENAG